MSETIQQRWFRRWHYTRKLHYTLWRDLVRGRLTGRMDWKARINASNLSESAKALLLNVVRRTRLWLLEKVDVATELIAHFEDGVEAGESSEQLIQSFGDQTAAAKLIRRAKIRNRPLVWHIKRALIYFVGALLVIYAGLILRMFTGHPTVKLNHITEINAKLDRFPVEDRAWPIYRRAILLYNDRPTTSQEAQEWDKMFDSRPGYKRWPATVQWLQSHQQVLDLIRKGSEKPVFGFILGRGGSAYDTELWPKSAEQNAPPLEKTGLSGLRCRN